MSDFTTSPAPFSEEQIHYLQGFAAGANLTQRLQGAETFAGAGPAPGAGDSSGGGGLPPGPETVHYRAQDAQTAAGKKLCPEESAKRKRFPLDVWDDLQRHAAEKKFPRGLDVLAFKYQGLFYVAPAQDSYMARLRFPGGIVPTYQFRRVADVAETWGAGAADVTTRANLQVREIGADAPVLVLESLHEAGIVSRGSGADNIRNVTGSSTAGVDPQELIDTRPLSRAMHHYILNHREMYGLPRKFNIAFDGGGRISAVEDTNDIGYSAVRVGAGIADAAGKPIEPGVYFRLALGGITGHKDFARDEGVLVEPGQCVALSAAIVAAFIDHGDRTDRKKARLKYLLDAWGHEKFLAEAESRLGTTLPRLALDQCEARPPVDRQGHIGWHPQRQPGLFYVGVALPVGRLTVAQMRGLADIADRRGAGIIRLTVWQNLLISGISQDDIPAVKAELKALGLSDSAASLRAGIIACTGAAGCKFAMAHTKQHAMQLVDALEGRLELDLPINVHLTGCPNSCAQHYMGDVGLMGTKVEVGEDMVEAYHVYLGGGYGADQAVGRELYRGVLATQLAAKVERMLRAYLGARASAGETFNEFVRQRSIEQLLELFEREPAPID